MSEKQWIIYMTESGLIQWRRASKARTKINWVSFCFENSVFKLDKPFAKPYLYHTVKVVIDLKVFYISGDKPFLTLGSMRERVRTLKIERYVILRQSVCNQCERSDKFHYVQKFLSNIDEIRLNIASYHSPMWPYPLLAG